MKTITLPIRLVEEDARFIKDLQRQQSLLVRFIYNRLLEGKQKKEINAEVKKLKNIPNMDSWFIDSALIDAQSIMDMNTEKKKVVFGGKRNFYKRLKGKMTNAGWKEARLRPLYSIGEATFKGNRKIKLDMVNNQFLFRTGTKDKLRRISISLSKMSNNWLTDLTSLQERCNQKKEPVTVHLTTTSISLTFEEAKEPITPIPNRVMGIDLNPNYISFSVFDIKDNTEKQNVLFHKTYDLTKLLKTTNNKVDFEINEIGHQIIRYAKHYRVEILSMEDLSVKVKNHGKGRKFNKLVNNNWKRNLILILLRRLSGRYGIKFKEINPAYTSFCGNMIYDYFDAVNASIEIGRRGIQQYIKGRFYPDMVLVKELWKQHLTGVSDWKELYLKIKTLNIKYRVPLPAVDINTVGQVFRINSTAVNVI